MVSVFKLAVSKYTIVSLFSDSHVSVLLMPCHMDLTVCVRGCEVGRVQEFMAQVSREICNESKEPDFEHKHKIREAEWQAVAESTEEHRTEGQKAQLRP